MNAALRRLVRVAFMHHATKDIKAQGLKSCVQLTFRPPKKGSVGRFFIKYFEFISLKDESIFLFSAKKLFFCPNYFFLVAKSQKCLPKKFFFRVGLEKNRVGPDM